jgi:hypothetical protein
MGGTVHVFRYRGNMDWDALYRGTVAFFRDRRFEIKEPKYKMKSDEIEGKLRAEQRLDAYNSVYFEIEYKIIDMRPVTFEQDGKQVQGIFGKLRMEVTGDNESHYKRTSMAGKQEIFASTKKNKPGILHRIYERVTFREREENIEDNLAILAQRYLEWVKGMCGMGARHA